MKRSALMLSAVLLLSGCQFPEDIKKQFSGAKQTEPKQEESAPTKENAQAEGPQLEAAYFNQTKEVNGQPVITNPENVMALVNKQYALASQYAPADLVRPNVTFSFGDEDIEKSYMRKEAAQALEKLFAAAKQEDVHLFAVSGYRSYSRQQEVMNNQAAKVGAEKALESVAPPGQSEHQTGLAMDISAESVGYDLTQSFETTKEGQWLADNAHKFGFILRYPKGKEEITLYMYEPWHFRYVGPDAAEEIKKNEWTLEEYFKNVKKI
ncbi:D-alanyl-D-alanine carboxypeptidase [Bacillus ectoiniformans]|uniref:M15 family metallopeptidase n=1 Tax=Bacillus ectoiniformans TaxID=1494429 RepID=UPI00195A9AE2|nr:M15 family metallopeptidase [Bacillus ectoiniformans]MBM7647893.1 D-alanyl-D-alanine carboxypeptidase [Bacillus ectoiniformans]